MSHHASSWAIAQSPLKPDGRADPIAKLVLLCVADVCDERGVTWRSSRSLSELAGLTPTGVRSAMDRLEATGLLCRVPRHRRSNGSQSSSVVVLAPDAERWGMGDEWQAHPALASSDEWVIAPLPPDVPTSAPDVPTSAPDVPTSARSRQVIPSSEPCPPAPPEQGDGPPQAPDPKPDRQAGQVVSDMLHKLRDASPDWQAAIEQGADGGIASLVEQHPHADWSAVCDAAVRAKRDRSRGGLRTRSPRRALELKLADHDDTSPGAPTDAERCLAAIVAAARRCSGEEEILDRLTLTDPQAADVLQVLGNWRTEVRELPWWSDGGPPDWAAGRVGRALRDVRPGAGRDRRDHLRRLRRLDELRHRVHMADGDLIVGDEPGLPALLEIEHPDETAVQALAKHTRRRQPA